MSRSGESRGKPILLPMSRSWTQWAKPLEASGVYSIFNAKYCLNVFILTHSSYKFSPQENSEGDNYMAISPLHVKEWESRCGDPPPHVKNFGSRGRSSWKLLGFTNFQCKILSKLFHFSTFFLHIFTYRKTMRGIITWTFPPPHVKKRGPGGEPPPLCQEIGVLRAKLQEAPKVNKFYKILSKFVAF